MGYRNIPSEVRNEYGEPMSEVIKGYALMGYSKRATAEAMGIERKTLDAWIRRMNLNHHFHLDNYNRSCRAIHHHIRNDHAEGRPRVYQDSDLLSCVAQCPQYWRFNAQMEGFPAGTTVIRRFGSWERAKRLAGVSHG